MMTKDDIAAQFEGFTACNCGRKHEIKTTGIQFGQGVTRALTETLAGVLPEGSRLLYIFDSGVKGATAVKAALDKKYRLALCSRDGLPAERRFAADITLDEDTRGIVCAGGGAVADVAKYVAAKCRLPLFMVGTSQATAGYLVASSMLYADGFFEVYKTVPPDYFFLDTDHLTDDAALNAAGFGEVCSRLTALFDWEFAGEVNGEDYCKTAEKYTISIAADMIKAVENAPASAHTLIIARAVVRLSALMQLVGDSRLMCGGDMQIMHALALLYRREGRQVKLWGENEMLVSQVALRIYIALIEGGGELGFIPPPDNNMRLDALIERFGLNPARAFTKVRPYITLDELLRQGYCLDECRSELLFKLKIYQKIMNNANRVFKRLYKDKGYSYNEYITSDDLSLCVGLAPDLREKFTTLTYMKQLGILDRYIA